jgi:hypothetical protein
MWRQRLFATRGEGPAHERLYDGPGGRGQRYPARGAARRPGAGGLTLDPTAFVHEAYLRLISDQADLVQVRYFGGLPISEAARVLGISARTAHHLWAHARAWLY